jgi:hypothetical protein
MYSTGGDLAVKAASNHIKSTVIKSAIRYSKSSIQRQKASCEKSIPMQITRNPILMITMTKRIYEKENE